MRLLIARDTYTYIRTYTYIYTHTHTHTNYLDTFISIVCSTNAIDVNLIWRISSYRSSYRKQLSSEHVMIWQESFTSQLYFCSRYFGIIASFLVYLRFNIPDAHFSMDRSSELTNINNWLRDALCKICNVTLSNDVNGFKQIYQYGGPGDKSCGFTCISCFFLAGNESGHA